LIARAGRRRLIQYLGELPDGEKPVTRLLHYGAGALATDELLACGFGWFPVHGLEDTVPIPGFQGQSYDAAVATGRAFVETLPLLDVAQAWGLTVATYHGGEERALGYAQPSQQIGLGVANLSTWAHELVHRSFRLRLRNAAQAEHRLDALTRRGQDREQEIVAELGGAVLLTVLGQRVEADVGPQRHDLVQQLGVAVVAEPLAHGAHRDFPASLATLSAVGRPPSPSGVEVGS
jgi:hypothetical protein